MTALPVPESRLTVSRTVAPLVIIWSAIVWNALLSPCAFWMSYFTPAALKASSRYLWSAVSQRLDDLLSGRMTPIFGVLVALLPLLSSPLLQAARLPTVITPMAVRARRLLRMIAQIPLGVPPRGGASSPRRGWASHRGWGRARVRWLGG